MAHAQRAAGSSDPLGAGWVVVPVVVAQENASSELPASGASSPSRSDRDSADAHESRDPPDESDVDDLTDTVSAATVAGVTRRVRARLQASASASAGPGRPGRLGRPGGPGRPGWLVHARVTLAPMAPASALFEQRHSTEATSIAASAIGRWAASSRSALRLLSRGDYDGARRALLQAQAISSRAAEALNRETLRARQVLDTCLYVVRASLETGDVPAAEEQARNCRRLVPRMQASSYTHTPEVRELVARIDSELESEPAGTLTVESPIEGCNVRINGVYFGRTPLRTSELPRGQYRVQVECDETLSGRIHPVEIGQRNVRLRVRTSFERAVRSKPGLALVYSSTRAASRQAFADGAEIARALGKRIVVVLPARDVWTLVVITPEGRREDTLQIDAAEGAATRERLARFLSGGGGEHRHGEPSDDARIASSDDRDRDESDERESRDEESGALDSNGPGDHRRRDPVAITLLTLGAAALATSPGLLVLRAHRADVMLDTPSSSADYLPNQRAYVNLRPFTLGTSVTGGLLGASGVGRLVRRSERRSAYAWAGGVVGVGLFTWATVDALRAPICIQRPYCVAHDAAIDRATLIASLATPALAMPLAAVAPARNEISASVHIGRSVAMLELRGNLE